VSIERPVAGVPGHLRELRGLGHSDATARSSA
jgi:hypothetical protein